MRILDFLSIETCRLCQIAIEQRNCDAVSICKDCWDPLIGQEAQSDLCNVPGFGDMRVAHGVKYELTIKKLVYRLKYDKDKLIAEDLSLLLNKAYMKLQELDPLESPLMVPIPLSFWRKFKRGFNQSELLAQHLSKHQRVKIKQGLLKRVKNTQAQHDLSREKRRVNLEGAFKANLERSGNIILIDDIHTTGSTLAEAAAILYQAGAKRVGAITVARALLHQHNSLDVTHAQK